MQPKPKSLTTAADELINIVRREKEVSFSQVAKELGVNTQTIEAWATFLEEDGVVSIKYKMTTPYLTLPTEGHPEKPKKIVDALFQDKLESAEIKSELENVSDLLVAAESRRKEGEFGALESIYQQILSKMKKITQFFSSFVHVSPQIKADLLEKFSEAEAKAKNASELLKSNKFDEANAEYSDIESQLSSFVQEAKSDFSEAEDLNVSREAGLKRLLDKTYELLEKGKLEEAVSNYEKSKGILTTFSQQWHSEKSSMQDSIIKLNRDIVIYSNKIKQQRMHEGSRKISALVNSARESMRKRKFATAAAYYGEIRKVFEKLPDGFAKEKRKMKEDVLKVFGQLIEEKEKRLKYRFDLMSKEIESMLKDAEKQLGTGNAEEALKTYNSISKAYDQLPHGFLKKRFELQGMIARLYGQLSTVLEKEAESELSAEATQILRLLQTMKQQVDSGRFSEASATYSEINGVFKRLPEGFVQQKTELQKRIVELYEKLLESVDKEKSQEFNSSAGQIDTLLSSCRESLKKGDYANANSLYKELKEAYSKLSPIDVARRQQIRNKILALYRNIIVGEQSAQPEAMQSDEQSKKKAIALERSPAGIHQKIEELKSRSKAQVRLPA